jgi:Fe2+ or Zn2+ uptake regulation protein
MFKEIIQKAGHKLTKPRLLVLEVFEGDHKTLSAKEIYSKLQKRVDLASVYRIVGLFKELGIIYEERVGNKEYFYLADKQHHHIVCRECGYTECVPCNHLFSKIKNFSNIFHQLSLSGVCKKCNN